MTIIGAMLPFHLRAAAGDPAFARAAILELIKGYHPGNVVELDLIGRMIGFSAAAMDSLRLSMREGLSDTKVLQYRNAALALGRMAEQCRNVLEKLQMQRQVTDDMAARAQAIPMPHPTPAPDADPHAPPQAATPSAQPRAPVYPVPAQPVAAAASPAEPVSAVDEDPALALSFAAMHRNTQAMLAALQAMHEKADAEQPDALNSPDPMPPNPLSQAPRSLAA